MGHRKICRLLFVSQQCGDRSLEEISSGVQTMDLHFHFSTQQKQDPKEGIESLHRLERHTTGRGCLEKSFNHQQSMNSMFVRFLELIDRFDLKTVNLTRI